MEALPHGFAEPLLTLGTLLSRGLSNAAWAAALALLLLPAARLFRRLRRPALAHALALLVLVKLVTPGALVLPVFLPAVAPAAGARAAPPVAAPAPTPAEPTEPTELPVGALVTPMPLGTVGGVERQPGAPPTAEATAETVATVVPPAIVATPPTGAARGTGAIRALRPNWTNWMNWRNWKVLLAAAWAAGSAGCAWVVLRRLRALRRLIRLALPAPAAIQEEADALAGRLGLAAAPPVWFLPCDVTPMLVGVFARPRLLVPQRLWDRLDHRQRQTLLLHELAHFRRRDHWVRYLELLTTVLYWWHPAAWWARSSLREAEEQCCDAWVVWALPGAARTYMSTLLDALEFLTDGPEGSDGSGGSIAPAQPAFPATHVLASGMGQFHCLQRRLKMVREQNVQRRLTGAALAAVLAAAAALPLAPRLVRGQQPQAPDAQAPEARKPDAEKPAVDRAVDRAVETAPEAAPDAAAPGSPDKPSVAIEVATDVPDTGARGAGSPDAAKADTGAKPDAGSGASAVKALRWLVQDVTGARAAEARARAEAERAEAERRAVVEAKAAQDDARAKADEARALALQREESAKVAENYAKEAEALKMQVQKLQAELAASQDQLARYQKMLKEHPDAANDPNNPNPKNAKNANKLPGSVPGTAAEQRDPKMWAYPKAPGTAAVPGAVPGMPPPLVMEVAPPPGPKIAVRYYDGKLEATDSNSGRTMWVYQTSPETRMVMGGGNYILLRLPDQVVVALDPKTGKTVKEYTPGPAGRVGEAAPGTMPGAVPGAVPGMALPQAKPGAAGVTVERDRLAELEARLDKLTRVVEKLSDSLEKQGQPGWQGQKDQPGQQGQPQHSFSPDEKRAR